MDYRLQTVLEQARRQAERSKQRAANYRTASQNETADDDGTPVDYEVQIATATGAQSAYDWVVGQLDSFEIEVAGGPPPPQAPVYEVTDEKNDAKSGAAVKLRRMRKAAAEYLDTARKNGELYSWYDAASYVQAAKEQVDAMTAVLDDM